MAELPRFIICEKTGTWAAAIRWQQGARPLPLHETRSLIDLRTAWSHSPTSIAAVEVTPSNAESALRLILETRTVHPAARVILLLTAGSVSLAVPFLEVGVSLVVVSKGRLDRVVRLVERHLAEQTLPELTIREAVWTRLPWQRET